jgi:hypothetical protein
MQHVLVEEAHHVDRQEVHRVHEEHPDEHGQRERRDGLQFAVIDPLDLLVDEIDRISTNACVFDGTPGVDLRATSHRKPNARTPRTIDVTTVSTFTVQKPPDSLALVRNVRWCWMYDVEVSSDSAATALFQCATRGRKMPC